MKYSIRDTDLLIQDLKLLFKALVQDAREYTQYKILGEPMPSRILPPQIGIQWKYNKNTNSFFAKGSTIPDIFTTSNTVEGIIDNVNDVIYEYYDIPRFFVKKIVREKGNFYSPPIEALEALRRDGYKDANKLLSINFNRNRWVPSPA